MLACLCCRVERRERARLKNVKFSGKGSDPKVRYTFTSDILSVSSLCISPHSPCPRACKR